MSGAMAITTKSDIPEDKRSIYVTNISGTPKTVPAKSGVMSGIKKRTGREGNVRTDTGNLTIAPGTSDYTFKDE
jgi:hypothetical protein